MFGLHIIHYSWYLFLKAFSLTIERSGRDINISGSVLLINAGQWYTLQNFTPHVHLNAMKFLYINMQVSERVSV